MAFSLPSESTRRAAADDHKAPHPADVSQPLLRTWLEALQTAHAAAASFETRLRWSPGSATGSIDRAMQRAGFRTVAKPGKFVVTGSYGPLREGEIERAREWGADLRIAIEG